MKSIRGLDSLKFRLSIEPFAPTVNGAVEPASTVNIPLPGVGHVTGGGPELYQLMQPPVVPFPLTTTEPLPRSRIAVPKFVIGSASADPGIVTIAKSMAKVTVVVRKNVLLAPTAVISLFLHRTNTFGAGTLLILRELCAFSKIGVWMSRNKKALPSVTVEAARFGLVQQSRPQNLRGRYRPDCLA
jgi:hypothetical protein